MKKLLRIILFCLLVVGLGGLVYMQDTSKEARRTELTKNCTNMNSRDFASERAHGIILRDRTIATIRLEGERNFSPPGGHIETGETPKQALRRELSEELSISTQSNSLKSFKTYCEVLGATKTQRTHTFLVENWNGEIQVNAEDQFKWVNSEYRLDPNADTELVSLLGYLKEDNLID